MDSTPLVLLHPYPLDATFWAPMRRDVPNEWEVIAPNAPGFGGRVPRAGWQISDAADEIARIITRRSPTGRAHIMGLSLGGYLALALAARHPDRCARLILADTRADADSESTRAARAAAREALRSGGRASYVTGLLDGLLRPDAPASLISRVCTIIDRQPDDALINALVALAERPDRTSELARLRHPTLVCVGEFDAITPPALASSMAAAIPNSRLAIIPDAGHLSAIEAPQRLAEVVTHFLAQPARPAQPSPGIV